MDENKSSPLLSILPIVQVNTHYHDFAYEFTQVSYYCINFHTHRYIFYFFHFVCSSNGAQTTIFVEFYRFLSCKVGPNTFWKGVTAAVSTSVTAAEQLSQHFKLTWKHFSWFPVGSVWQYSQHSPQTSKSISVQLTNIRIKIDWRHGRNYRNQTLAGCRAATLSF